MLKPIKIYRVILILGMYVIPITVFGQKKIVYELANLQREKKLKITNRSPTIVTEAGKTFIRLDTAKGDGMIWLPVKAFSNGTIELVARGQDILQGSFYGIIFHGIDDKTFDDVYLRPFNFRTTDSIRKIHAIQYRAAPLYDWVKLRKEHNGVYEKGIANAPSATDWVTLTLVVKGNVVKAFVNHSAVPALTVIKLNQNTIGKVGLSGINADYERLTISYEDTKPDQDN